MDTAYTKDTAVEDIEALTTRTLNALQARGCHTIEDITKYTLAEWRRTRHCGPRTLDQIRWIVEEAGLEFGDSDAPPYVMAPQRIARERVNLAWDLFNKLVKPGDSDEQIGICADTARRGVAVFLKIVHDINLAE